eukprot:scaffold99945_cov60-Phaeocystis_antarctica.AAC.2
MPGYDVSCGVFCCVSALPRGAYTSTAHGAVCVLRVGSCALCSLAPRWDPYNLSQITERGRAGRAGEPFDLLSGCPPSSGEARAPPPGAFSAWT